DGCFSKLIIFNFKMASLSQNRSRPILRWRRLLKIPGVQFRDAGNLSKFVLNFGMPPSSRNRPRSIVRSRGLLQIGGLQFQHGMFSSMHSSKSSRTHACPPACTPAQGSCTHVLQRVCQHESRARMFSGVHASTSLVYACSPVCTPARASCTHVLRHTTRHQAHARMFSRVHVSTRLVYACSPACTPARASCTHVLRTRLP